MPPSRRRRSRRETVRILGTLSAMGVLALALVVGAAVWLNGSLRSDAGDALEDLTPQVDVLSEPLPASLLQGEVTYLALGDSYAAGPGIVPLRDDPAACQRSARNYPALLAEVLGVEEYVDRSCTGATSRNLVAAQVRSQFTVTPQLEDIPDDVDVVTIGMGANDIGIYPNVIIACTELAATDPAEGACREAEEESLGASMVDRAVRLEEDLVTALAEVRGAAPRAQIVVIGYPRVFPATGTCDQLGMSATDAAWAGEVMVALNASLRSAAERVGVRFVDLAAAGSDHHVCADRPWMAGADPVDDAAAAWHPYAEGMSATAGVIRAQLVTE